MSEKYKKTYKHLNYVEQLLQQLLVVFQFLHLLHQLLACVPVGIAYSEVAIKICTITAGIKKYQSIKKKKRKHDKIVLLGKGKLKTIEIQISKALINSYISCDEFVSVNNVLREYNKIKDEIKSLETSVEYIMYNGNILHQL